MTINLHGLKERIELQKENFTSVEQHIANFLLITRDSLTYASIETLAQQINVSKASISRFAKKLGYSGYLAMKHDLDYAINQNYLLNTDRYRDEKNYYGLVIKDYMELLSAFIVASDFSQIIHTVEQIHSAKRVLILGLGNSGNIANDFCSKLSYLGVNAIATSHMEAIKIIARHSSPDDFIICFSRSGTSECIQQALIYARENKTATTLITTNIKKTIQAQASYSIVLPGKELFMTNKVLSNQIPQLFIAEVLYSELIKLAPEYYEQKLAETASTL